MPNLVFSTNKYIVYIQVNKYNTNIYNLCNKLNGFLRNRSNYFKIDPFKRIAYYTFGTLAEVNKFYRDIKSAYTGINYSYTILKTGKYIQL